MESLLLKNAKFVTSSPDVGSLPEENIPEFAFLGRSNVGKSSLINLVCGQNRLAHTSNTPGRTRLLNYFSATLQKTVDQERQEKFIGIVDLPGVGYAKVSKAAREDLSVLLTNYIAERPQIRAVFHLVDIRRDPTMEDIELGQQLMSLQPAYVLVVTKADKVTKSAQKSALLNLANPLSVPLSELVVTSTSDKFGQDAIWERMWKYASNT